MDSNSTYADSASPASQRSGPPLSAPTIPLPPRPSSAASQQNSTNERRNSGAMRPHSPPPPPPPGQYSRLHFLFVEVHSVVQVVMDFVKHCFYSS